MSEVKITDLVDQKAIDQLKDLDAQLKKLVETFTATAADLAKGIDIPVKSLADIERLEKLLAERTKEATEANARLNDVLAQRAQVTANTTNTIARQLMEQERLNKTQRAAYTEHERVKNLLEQFHDTYEGQLQRLIKLDAELKKNTAEQKENEKALKQGLISSEEYAKKQTDLVARSRELRQEKSLLNQIMTAEEKANQQADTSYAKMSQQLELLKKAYKGLSAEGRDSDYGKELENTIQNLDMHLKDLAADMGEFQRNVGNYAIAGRNGIVTTESVMALLKQEARTLKDVADQTKLLTEAKSMLDIEDVEYEEIVSQINDQLAENSKRLSDVSDIMGRQAITAGEAEEQNKRLLEAMKNVDQTSEGASERIAEMNAQVEQNRLLIEAASPSRSRATDEQISYNVAVVDGVASLDSLNEVLTTEASTMEQVEAKMKALQRALTQLDESDANYQDSVARTEQEINSLRGRLMDVNDIMEKSPRTVAEAEEQNRKYAIALKHIDVNAAGAKEQIAAIRERIEENEEMIRNVTGTNDEYADSLLSLVGINGQFGSSLQSLSESGSKDFLEGMNTKVKAFGKTLLGLLANPWVLAFLGIAGVVAGVKWWFDYNKGLVEATKLTKDFTGLSGDELKAVRNEVQATADTYGKDFKEVLEATNAMSKQFGISASEALKLVQDGFVAGADANGEFLENVKEYPAYFKEAGISASEFVAITAQANKAGIYSDKGIDVIKEGNLRIREMTKATKDALEGIGISAADVQKKLADGTMTTFDVMQMVSAKLAEFPESSAEVGTALADIFGGPGEDAGLQYILTLKDIEKDLDKTKAKAGELGKLQEEQMRSQIELQNTISAVFDQTGGGFEGMTTKAKIMINNGLIAMVKWFAKVGNGVIDVVNWFINLYNNSLLVRGAVNSIVNSFKTVWEVGKFVINQLVDSFASVGKIIEGVLTLDSDKISEGWAMGMKSLKQNFSTLASNIADNFADTINTVMKDKIAPVTFRFNEEGYKPSLRDIMDSDNPTSTGNGNNYSVKESEEDKKAREKAAKEAQKQAQETLKILAELQESQIALMAEGHEKELAIIRLNFKKKLDAIKGHSANEEALRLQIVAEMNAAIAKADEEYYRNMAKINLDNRLASVKEGSKEEFDLKMAMLQSQHDAEVREAAKTGADVALINAKYEKQKTEMKEDYASKQSSLIAESYADEASKRDAALTLAEAAENEAYLEKMKAAKGNATQMERVKAEHEDNLLKLQEDYARKSADAAIAMLEKQLAVEDLTAEERAQLENALAKAKADKEKLIADQAIEQMNRTAEEDTKLKEKRIANAQMWLQTSADVFNNVNDLAQAIFDGKIQKLEEEQEANNAASEAEQTRISELAEKKVITEEEAEARKRAALAKSEQKNAELEAKKQKLKEKQAKWDRANAIAQCGIQTALAIMNALQMQPFPVGIAMAAIAGAMGAVQLATILATPIPKYAKGTDYHKGGPAIVGDGGRQEVVVFNNRAWLTPDTPTVVDLPAGASVIPSVEMLTNNLVSGTETRTNGVQVVTFAGKQNVVVDNNTDTRRLEERLDNLASLIKQQTKMHRDIAYDREYEIYKNNRI